MTTFTVTVDIPTIILRELKEVGFKTKKSLNHALRLIAVTLYELECDETHTTDDFYKGLSNTYIDSVTTDHFYKKTFSKKLKGQLLKDGFHSKLFQTDGGYKVKYYPKHYRINPEFLEGPTEEISVEITFETYNDIFPELIEHFRKSVALIKSRLSIHELSSVIQNHAMQMTLTSTGAFSAFYFKNFTESLDFNSDENKIIEPILLKGSDKKKYMLSEIEAIIKSDLDENGQQKLMLIQSKNKSGKDVFELAQFEEFLKRKGNHLAKRVCRAVSEIANNKWRPIISESNGRFNHQFTNIDKFCIDHFEFEGEEICSYDLKSSQPTILANILCANPSLQKSISNTKYRRLKAYYEINKNVFFNEVETSWLKQFVNNDIYRVIAKEQGITRNQAKKEMMVLFFTEPTAPSAIATVVSNHYPEFFNGLKSAQHSFKKTLKSSKKTLPVFLQFVEAHIFLEIIYSELAKANIPSITKHDSILLPKSRFNEVELIVAHCFNSLGFKGKMVLEESKSLSIEDQISAHFRANMRT